MQLQPKPTKETLTQVLEYLASNGVEFTAGNSFLTPEDILAIHDSTEEWGTASFCHCFNTRPEVMKEWHSHLTLNDEVRYPCCEVNVKGLPCRKGGNNPKAPGVKGNFITTGFTEWGNSQRDRKYCWFHFNKANI